MATVLAGFLAGLLVGLTGIGGGAVLTPALLLLGVPLPAAVGSDLLAGTLTKLAGLFHYLRRGEVAWGWALRLALPGVPGALLGSWWAVRLAARPAAMPLLHRLLGLALVLSAAVTLARLLRPRRSPAAPAPAAGAPAPPAAPRALGLLGALVGLLVGLTSVGAGSLVAPLLLAGSLLGPRQVVGTDLAAGLLVGAAATLAHGLAGDVRPGLVAALLAGSLPGVWLGGRLAARLPLLPLRLLLSGTVLALGLAWLR
ncbi:MAG: sulfite exporter TauE/SafE family protein [Firmicutes bacterium]|nr:sulfite exporter TauE/SafE family protein [Bacillota bacterium]